MQQVSKTQEAGASASVKQRLRMLRAMSHEDIAKVIARDRDERGMRQPSDAVLQAKVYNLKRSIRPRDFRILTTSSDPDEIMAALGISRGHANNLRTTLVSFGLAESFRTAAPEVKAPRKYIWNGEPAHRTKEELAETLDRIRAAILKNGPTTLEELAQATGYRVDTVRRYTNSYLRILDVKKFDLARDIVGNRSGRFGMLFKSDPTKVYLIDDSDPGSLVRFKKFILDNCVCQVTDIRAMTSLGHLFAGLKNVIPGAAQALDEIKQELKRRNRVLNA
ncbi:MAG: hypothetical protein KGH58_00645 [Candidatus Micrarchaeota archaeon]|nr:hypothetical protein [Candidatus Micrarchaeota archaeon]